MSEFIELKDLIHLKGKLTHDNFIFKNLKRIEFKHEVSDELAYLDINKHSIKNREFAIKKGNSEIVLKGNKNYDFEIIDLSKNEKWKPFNPIKIIAISNKSFYKSEFTEIQIVSNGYGKMVYSENNFIGRIKRKRIDIKDENYTNILIGICFVDLISNNVYKLNETND